MNKFLTVAVVAGLATGSYVFLSDSKTQKSMHKTMKHMRRTAMKQIGRMM